MSDLKLARLPDRTPVKITLTVTPELNQALRDYADLYRAAYGQEETVADLIPFMLEAFLDSDRAFIRARKSGAPANAPAAEIEPRRGRKLASPPSPPPDPMFTDLSTHQKEI